MVKACGICEKVEFRTLGNGMQKLLCRGEGDGVNAFHSCENFEDRQCTLCQDEKSAADEFPCLICAELKEKPYFKRAKEDLG